MTTFETLFNEYANTKNGDVYAFCRKYKQNSIATRFLLIRTFDSDNLKQLLKKHRISFSSGREKELMKIAYHSSITINDLLCYIESKRPQLIKKREEEVEGLQDVLHKIPIVNCGVRNDNVDTIVQEFTRDKSLKTYEALVESLNSNTLSRVKQYCLWSYYNQTSNDIIELFFLKHPNDDEIIPFDLKITYISDDFFGISFQRNITFEKGT